VEDGCKALVCRSPLVAQGYQACQRSISPAPRALGGMEQGSGVGGMEASGEHAL
jgi:hypothetical protein